VGAPVGASEDAPAAVQAAEEVDPDGEYGVPESTEAQVVGVVAPAAQKWLAGHKVQTVFRQ